MGKKSKSEDFEALIQSEEEGTYDRFSRGMLKMLTILWPLIIGGAAWFATSLYGSVEKINERLAMGTAFMAAIEQRVANNEKNISEAKADWKENNSRVEAWLIRLDGKFDVFIKEKR